MAPLRRNRDFVLLWTGQVASALGTRTASIAYPLIGLAVTGSPAQAGLLVFAGRLPWFLFTLPAGAIADRVDRKRLMVMCDAAAASAMVAAALALWMERGEIPVLFLAAFVEGTAFIVAHVASDGALRRIVPADQLPDAVALASTRETGAALAGPPLGGVLLGVSRGLPFVANALSYLASMVTLLAIRTPLQDPARPRGASRLAGDVREGVTWLWRQPFVRATSLAVGGFNFCQQGLQLVLIVVMTEGGASPAEVGAMISIVAGAGFLGSLAAPRVRRRFAARTVVVGYGWLAVVIVVPLVLVAPNPYALGATYALLVFFGPTWNAVVDGYRIALVPDGLQSRVSSASALLAFGAIPLGPLVGGLLAEQIGGDGAIIALGACVLALAIACTASRAIRAAPYTVARATGETTAAA